MSKAKARELTANPLKAQPKPEPRADEIPLWRVWRWSIAHPGVSPWKDDGQAVLILLVLIAVGVAALVFGWAPR